MQKITPFLWFDNQAEEAINLYTSCFKNSQITSMNYYPEGRDEPHMQGMEGKVLTAIYELENQQFMALDGGSVFKFSPALSFFVNCETEAEVDALYATLSDGGSVLMELQAYPFSEKFAWIADKFGLSWQLSLAPREQKITPFMMFVGEQHGKAEEAINFYTSLFENSGMVSISRYAGGDGGDAGTVQHAIFKLHGQEFMAIDSNYAHDFTFTEAMSFYVNCETQDEVNALWDKLSAVPEAEQCGWLKDKYGISWQIIPTVLGELLSDPDPVKSERVMTAMLQMKKIDIADLQKAHAG